MSALWKNSFVFLLFSLPTRLAVAQADTTATDTRAATPGAADTAIIRYSAKSIESFVDQRITILVGDAEVRYKDLTLKAGKITVEWDKNLLTAEGLPDTTNGASGDSVAERYTAMPVLDQGGEEMTGFKMEYNFKTEKGRVIRGRTEYEGGRYFGNQIKLVAPKVLNVSRGEFTTCDKPEQPHYHFWSRRMKLLAGDKVIAKPIVLYLGSIPVAALPFGIFPQRTGRHSGILIPRYGSSSTEGRYLRGMGYYWAPSDYWDGRFTVDFFERSGWLFEGGLNYAIRYLLKGSIEGSLTRKNFVSGQRQRRWDLQIRHFQELSPTAQLNVSGAFVSDGSFYKDLSSSIYQRLTRQLVSNATWSKSWPTAKFSLTANLSETRDLESGNITRVYPQLAFRRGQSQLFPTKDPEGKKAVKEEKKWYHYLYYSYNGNLLNSWSNTRPITRRLDHNLGFTLSSPTKYFGFLYMNHGLSYQENWYDRTQRGFFDPVTNQVQRRTERGFASRRTFFYSLSANTKLYGLFTPRIGRIKAIRHVVTPSISFSYRPDFSSSFWGYFDVVKLPGGQVQKIDRFGGTPIGAQKLLSFSLRNLFQMKTAQGEKEKKFDLFTLDFSGGYNFEATTFKMSNLNTSLRADPTRNISVLFQASHDFYAFDPQLRQRVNRLVFRDHRLPRLVDARLNVNVRLEGRAGANLQGRPTGEAQEEGQALRTPQELSARPEDRFGATEGPSQGGGFEIPWRASLNFSYDLNRANPFFPQSNAYLEMTGVEVQLTKNWRVFYSTRYDFTEREFLTHDLTIYRDLHCWEAQLHLTRSGFFNAFYFRINIKAPQLREIKFERRGGGGVYGY